MIDLAFVESLGKLAEDGVALALFFRLGKVVANHEIRIVTLEDHVLPTRLRRSGRARGRGRRVVQSHKGSGRPSRP